MDGFQVICTILVTVMAYTDVCMSDHEHMVTKAEPVYVTLNFETILTCQMNIEPDKFQWKFYPYNISNAYNSKAIISLTSASYELIPNKPSRYYKITSQKRTSDLTIQADSEQVAGEYQCLAYYGAYVVASVPWKLTLAKLAEGNFPEQNSIDVTVTLGNTINWRCEPPLGANPEPYIDYYKDGHLHKNPVSSMRTKFLIIPKVGYSHSGHYVCKVVNTFMTPSTLTGPSLNLRMVKNDSPQPPRFIMLPKSEYEVVKGGTVFLECSAIGDPVPQVVWMKNQGRIPEKRSELVEGGLVIKNVTQTDAGIYECIHKNIKGTISHKVTLKYLEPPGIDCFSNSTDVKQGETVDLDCQVTGSPSPEISWFLNGYAVNDSAIRTDGNRIYFRPVEKRHAGNLQIFARNVVQTVYSSISIKVIPLSTTQEGLTENQVPPTRGHRGGSRKGPNRLKMIPPSKPIISRLNDEAVMVRWSAPTNKGLSIQFFKVQYRELGPATHNEHHNRGKGSKWMTSNTDIPPHITAYEVNGLKPDYWYRFRIAAVYSNNDNTNGPTSDKFHLKRLDFDKKNPLPIPLITKTETLGTNSVKIFWKYDPSPNVTVEGFFVNYNSASSAADYMKATVDDPNATSYVLSHLQPDTVYDIKLQTFTSKSASEFSSIMKAKTLGVATTTALVDREASVPSSVTETAGISKLYIVIAGGVLGGFAVIVGVVILLLFLRKWKQKKNGDRDKGGVDDRHIQADGTEYVVGPKGNQRANGCVPSNRITITANPLADADNKNQNMIEMSCLSSQNNNCATVQPSVSGEDSPTNSRDKKNNKNREKRIRNKIDTPGENYV